MNTSGQNRQLLALVVNDNPVQLRKNSRILENQGFKVISLQSGVEAVELLEEGQRLDLVVTDLPHA